MSDDEGDKQRKIPTDEADLVNNIIEPYVNGSHINNEEIKNSVSNMHRYLQHEMFYTIIKPLIIGLAEQNTDKRNEKAVKASREIAETMGWKYE